MQKRIFITGAGKGIGRAIVLAFSQGNNQIAFCDIDKMEGEKLAKKLILNFSMQMRRRKKNWKVLLIRFLSIGEIWLSLQIMLGRAF